MNHDEIIIEKDKVIHKFAPKSKFNHCKCCFPRVNKMFTVGKKALKERELCSSNL